MSKSIIIAFTALALFFSLPILVATENKSSNFADSQTFQQELLNKNNNNPFSSSTINNSRSVYVSIKISLSLQKENENVLENNRWSRDEMLLYQ
jgi:flagellar basal body-associated protein FliL